MEGWEKSLGIAMIALAVVDLLDDFPRARKSQENARRNDQESAREFLLGGGELAFWCNHAQIDPGVLGEAVRRLDATSAEARKQVRAAMANVLLRPNQTESGDGLDAFRRNVDDVEERCSA